MSKWVDLDNIPYVCQDMTVKQLIEKTEIHENVIERSKIDKAIEEITNLNRYQEGIDTMNVGDDLMISWCKTLDILKEI